jgi:hypothetical protein
MFRALASRSVKGTTAAVVTSMLAEYPEASPDDLAFLNQYLRRVHGRTTSYIYKVLVKANHPGAYRVADGRSSLYHCCDIRYLYCEGYFDIQNVSKYRKLYENTPLYNLFDKAEAIGYDKLTNRGYSIAVTDFVFKSKNYL